MLLLRSITRNWQLFSERCLGSCVLGYRERVAVSSQSALARVMSALDSVCRLVFQCVLLGLASRSRAHPPCQRRHSYPPSPPCPCLTCVWRAGVSFAGMRVAGKWATSPS